jgi:predicted ester cyclase
MNKIEIVKKAFNFSTPVEEQKTYYADDYQASDATGSPTMDKTAWFIMGDLYRAAIPDAGYVFDEIHQDGEDVIVTGHFTGTFKNDMDLTSLNMGMIKATGKQVKFPPSSSRVSFRDNQISANKSLDTGSNASIAGFLATLSGEG